MNLKDERNYQMLQNVLDVMSLSAENRKLADQYLDMEQPENPKLLDKAVSQDFSRLEQNITKKCFSYIEHLSKRNRKDDLVRYVRFCVAVGGSTAKYVLFTGRVIFNLEKYEGVNLKEYLTLEQIAAIHAEMWAWDTIFLNIHYVKRIMDIDRQNPETIRKAMDLCYHKSGNAKTYLASIYLYNMRPSKSQKGFFKELFSKSENSGNVADVVNYLEDCLISSVPNLFVNKQNLTDEDKKTLEDFLHKAKSDAPFTGEIQRILDKGGKATDYLTHLLTGAAFFAIEHSDRFILFVRFTMYVNLQSALNSCKNMCGTEWLLEHIELLEHPLSVKPEDYGHWCVVNQVASPLQRMAKSDPDTIKRLLPSLSTEEYQFLVDQVKIANPSLYQTLSTNYDEEFRYKMATELTAVYETGKEEARNYLLGKATLSQLYPYVEEWRKKTWHYVKPQNYNKMEQMRRNKETLMFRRALVLEVLGNRPNFFTSRFLQPSPRPGVFTTSYNQVMDKREILEIQEMFEEEELSVSYQFEIVDAIYNSYYSEDKKNSFMNECVDALASKKAAWESELVDNAKNGSVTIRFLCIRVLNVYFSEYKDLLLSCAQDSSKQVRELLAAIYESHKEWEPEICAMLSSKKSQEREMAVQVIGKWGVDSHREEIEKTLEAEKSKKIKDQILSLLGMETATDDEEKPGQTSPQTTEQLVKELLKGGKRRKVEWAFEEEFAPVHTLDGTEVSKDYMQALLTAYADIVSGVSKDAARLAAELNQKELSDFMNTLFGKWMDGGAEAKKKWVLYAVSVHGGEEIIPTFQHQIQAWSENSRGAIAAEAVRALALNGSSTALLLVDQYSRKFKNRQVKTAAGEALTYAAEQLGITRMELEDRIVPNLDFDEKMERHFDYGTRSFRVRLTPMLELEIFDEEGKKIKNLPSPGKRDEEEKAKTASDAFKAMKKQLKTVVSNQKLRLEQALSTERLWTADKWQELFVKNPIMHQFAIGLIWGVYDQGALTDTFRYMEDGSFNTVVEDEYELSENAIIGLVHPLELSEETLSAWKEQLSDYEVIQPVEQLERPVYRITEEEKGEKELTRFGGMVINGLSLSGKLLSQGWYRGGIEDAGFYYTFYRNDGANGVELEFSGAPVGYENDNVTVYGVYFYPSGDAAQGSYRYQKGYEEKRCLLSEVSPRYFSEIILLLTRATASSQEKLSYPECKD